MFHRRVKYEPTAYDDNFEDIPAQGAFPKWFGGLIAPMGIAYYGGTCLHSRIGTLPGSRSSMEVHGNNAVALGFSFIGLALFLHCHYFWGNIYDQAAAAVLGKIVGLFVMIAGLIFLLMHVGILGQS